MRLSQLLREGYKKIFPQWLISRKKNQLKNWNVLTLGTIWIIFVKKKFKTWKKLPVEIILREHEGNVSVLSPKKTNKRYMM